jgi:tripartite-type tricarboxylate transporter receptor subunit TctC
MHCVFRKGGLAMVRRRAFVLAVVAASTLAATCAWADDWPKRPIKFIVPYAPGNQADTVARLMAVELSREYGQPFVVENAAGAGGVLGVAQIARAKPDGYTLGLAAIASMAIIPHLQRVPYDPKKDIDFVSAVTEMRVMGLAVGTNVPASNIAELIKYASTRPDRPLTFSTAGTGTVFHLAMETVSDALGQKFIHIPYRGSGGSITDVIGGQVDMVFDGIGLLKPQADAGKLKIIAVTDSTSPASPAGVKSFAQQGVAAGVKSPWQVVISPKGVPELIRGRLEESFARLASSAAFRAKLPAGTEALVLSGSDARQRMLDESDTFAVLARKLDLESK